MNATPSPLANNDVIRLKDRREALKLQKTRGMLGEKLTAVVGPTYFIGKRVNQSQHSVWEEYMEP